MNRIVTAALAATLLTVNTSAWALFGDDEARKAIIELRDQLKSQQEVQMGLYDRLEKLTKEVQNLRGQVDVLNNSLGKERQNTQDIYGALSSRIEEMDPKAKAAAAASDREIAAKQELDKCLAIFQKGDASASIACFTKLTQNYKRTKIYPDALYWLGSSHYMKGNLAQAISTEQSFISGYSKHAKVPEAYLVVGMAQMDSKKPQDAQATFNKLIKLYPKSEAAALARKQLK